MEWLHGVSHVGVEEGFVYLVKTLLTGIFGQTATSVPYVCQVAALLLYMCRKYCVNFAVFRQISTLHCLSSSLLHLKQHISGSDLLKLTREDVIQICGPADGIRLFNALKGRCVSSELT